MRSTWTYKLGQNIISIGKEKKDLGMVIQDNLYPEINQSLWAYAKRPCQPSDVSSGDHPVQVPFPYQVTPNRKHGLASFTNFVGPWPPPSQVIPFRNNPRSRISFWVIYHSATCPYSRS